MARRFQYSLKSLMAVVVVLGLAFARLEKYLAEQKELSEQRPIPWQPFSRALLEEKLVAGWPVLLKLVDEGRGHSRNPGVSPHAEILAALETPRIRRLLRSNGIIPMRADPLALYYRPFGNEFDRDLIRLGLNPITPAIAIFPVGNNAKPVQVQHRDLNEAKVIEAIHRAVRRP